MRSTFFFLLVLAFATACGGGASPKSSDLPANSSSGAESQNEQTTLKATEDASPAGSELGFDEAALEALLGDEPRAPLPLNRKRARLGAADAEVTILFFSDLECPYCAIAMRTIRELMERYPGKIRLYQLHYPLPGHVHADGAARVAEAIRVERGDAAFYEFISELHPDRERLSEGRLRELALSAGLSEAALDGALDEYHFDDEVRGDTAIGRIIGIRGTPASLLNGRLVPGAQSLETFEKVFLEELEIARKIRDLGVARGDEYRALVKLYFGSEGLEAMQGND